MAINVSGLSTYTNQHSAELITKAVTDAKVSKYATIQPNIKFKETINYMDSDTALQAASCGWNVSGSTSFTQKEIEVVAIERKESICMDTLNKYYLNEKMKAGSINDEMPFEEIYVNNLVQKVAEKNELLLWQGNKATGSGELSLMNGYLQIAGATASGVVSGGTASVSVSTIIAVVDAQVNAIPEAILNRTDLVMFTSFANFRLYTQALRNANLYHNAGENKDFEIMIFGTNVKLIATAGLTGTSAFVTTYADNMVVGTDLMSDSDTVKVWYSEDNDEVRSMVKYKLGAQFKYNEFVVYKA